MGKPLEPNGSWRAVVQNQADAGPNEKDFVRAREKGRGRDAEAPRAIPAAGWKDIVHRVFLSISANRLVANAGSVAFFALMAIFPAIGTLVSLYGMIADPRSITGHLNLLAGVFPQGVLDLIKQQILLVAGKTNGSLSTAFLISLVTALWSANSGTSALFDALNVVYGEKEKRSYLRLYATTLATTLASVIFVIAALTGVVILPVIWNLVGFVTPVQSFLSVARWPALFVFVTAGLAFIYRIGPSRRDAKWRWVTWGSIAAALAWIGTSILFSWYVAAFDSYNRVYGSLGAVVGFMTWIWLSVLIILIGGALNAEIEHQTAKDSTEGEPKPLGARGAHKADHVGRSISESR